MEELYYKVDHPFRNWLLSLTVEADKDEKIRCWYDELHKIVRKEAKELLSNGSSRDYIGIEVDGKIKNIATAYNRFINHLHKEL